MIMYFNGERLDNTKLSELQRAIIISLFTWRRADDSDNYDGLSKFGWWGDTFPEHDGDRIGSKLYQLLRRKLTGDVLLEAQEMCREALQWLMDDNLVSEFDVLCERSERDVNRLDVMITYTVHTEQSKQILKFLEVN